jgi:Cytochrome P450
MHMAFDTLQSELGQMVAQRRHELTAFSEAQSPVSSLDSGESGSSLYSQMSANNSSDGNFDLLSNLVRSALQSEKAGTSTLTEEEIVGNAYIYLLAGHETTAHSLAWTLALLAAYPEQQDKAYQEIMEGDPSEETIIRDYPKFRFLLACYYETLRLFPPVQQIPKIAAEDTQIVIERSNEVEESNLGTSSDFVAELPRAASAPELRLNRASFAGHRKRLSLPVLNIGVTLNRLDCGFGIPSLPSTPSGSPPKEYMGHGDRFSSATSRSEFIGPMPFAQTSKDGRSIEANPPFAGPEQKRVVVKKGTIIFISPPAVRTCLSHLICSHVTQSSGRL